MTGPPEQFLHSDEVEPHHRRRRELLAEHPEIRQLMGRNPYTFLVILALFVLQLSLASAVREGSWWIVLLLAYTAGAFVTHGLIVLMHDCSHHLVFRGRLSNLLAGILANLATVLPSSVSVQRYHLRHHAFQGVGAVDVDMPSEWEARLVGNSPAAKLLWLLLLPVFMAIRPFQLTEVRWLTRWTALNIAAVLAFDVAVLAVIGPRAFLYLALSFLCGLGLHPLGGRWIQEHFILDPPQETYSYYGPLRSIAFNIGYHNEHHDFPNIPWNRLPRLREIASDWYDSLTYHRSWTKLLLRFVFDRELSLFSRVSRTKRGRHSVKPIFGPPAPGSRGRAWR